MVNQARTKQGGSVINFFIVGVLLTVVTLGAVYVIQQRAQNDQPVPVAGPSSSPVAVPSDDRPSTSPSPSTTPSTSPVPSAPSAPSSVPSTGYLPQTGPVDSFVGTVVPTAFLLGMTIAFVRSRGGRFGSFRR